jgi:ATP-dependent DNA helicase RecG
MEKEGSGIDKIYESLLSSGKALPIVLEGDDFVSVRVERRILKKETILLLERARKDFDLSQRELISLGLIAENNSLSAAEFVEKLNLNFSSSANPTTQWLGKLQKLEIIKSKGKTKGAEYFVNPEFLKKFDFKGKTNLKGIEDHVLEVLICRDINIYQPSSVGEINQRIKDVPIRRLRTILSKMVKKDLIYKSGEKKWTKYFINKPATH